MTRQYRTPRHEGAKNTMHRSASGQHLSGSNRKLMACHYLCTFSSLCLSILPTGAGAGSNCRGSGGCAGLSCNTPAAHAVVICGRPGGAAMGASRGARVEFDELWVPPLQNNHLLQLSLCGRSRAKANCHLSVFRPLRLSLLRTTRFHVWDTFDHCHDHPRWNPVSDPRLKDSNQLH